MSSTDGNLFGCRRNTRSTIGLRDREDDLVERYNTGLLELQVEGSEHAGTREPCDLKQASTFPPICGLHMNKS